MKRKIVFAALLVAVLSANTVFAEISIKDGVLDRSFSEGRTLYYVKMTKDEIPDITLEGYETVSKATEAYSGGELTEKNTTVLKNKSTGKRYRFVFEKNKTGELTVNSITLGTDGKLEIKAEANNLENLKVFLLKPTAELSEDAYNLSDIDEKQMEKVVMDSINFEDASGGVFEYTFPKSAVSGCYRVVITADGLTEDFNDTVYYMSGTKITEVLGTMNNKTQIDESTAETTKTGLEELQEYVEKNAKALYLDTTYYDKISDDDGKLLVMSALKSEGDYGSLDDIGEKFYKATAVAAICYGQSVPDVLKEYNDKYLKFDVSKEYGELTNTGNVDSALRGITDETTLKNTFNRRTCVAYFNEAEPEKKAEVLRTYNQYIGVSTELYDYFMANTDECIKSMRTGTYADTADIENAIKAVKDGGSEGVVYDGVKKNTPSTGGGSVAPITQQKTEINKETDKTESTGNTENKLPFKDIEGFDWAYTAIEHLYNNKILNGKSDTEFAPAANVMREEFAKLIVTAFALEGTCELNFTDVDESAWYADYIKTAVANEIVKGISETEFGVGKNITREDMAVMILRAVEKTGIDTEIIVENPAELSDLETVSEYAREAIEFLIQKGAINGINGEIKPKNFATRAQAAKILYQIIKIR